MSYPWKHHGYVRLIVHRWLEPVRKADPSDRNFTIDSIETFVEILETETFQLGFKTRKNTPDWVADEVSEFGEERAKELLEPASYEAIRKAEEPPEPAKLSFKLVDLEPLPKVLPVECVVEIVGEFWYWGGMTFNGESEEFDADWEIRQPHIRVLTDAEAKFYLPPPAKPEYYYQTPGHSTIYKEGSDPEVTCWHCHKTFLCDPMDATCRLCSAPYDKSRCDEFRFKPQLQPMEDSHVR